MSVTTIERLNRKGTWEICETFDRDTKAAITYYNSVVAGTYRMRHTNSREDRVIDSKQVDGLGRHMYPDCE